MTENFSNVTDPRDATYAIQRQQQIDELLKLSSLQLDRRLNWQMSNPDAIKDEHGVSTKYMNEIVYGQSTPVALRKGILDSTTGGTTGGYLIRQDLEPTLFVSGAFSR